MLRAFGPRRLLFLEHTPDVWPWVAQDLPIHSRNFAQKYVLKLVKQFSGHYYAIKS